MRVASCVLVAGASLVLLAAGCSDKTTAPGPSATEVPLDVSMSEAGPARYVTDELNISARELLRRSDAAMQSVDYLRLYEAQDATPGPSWSFGIHETVAPFTIASVVELSLMELDGHLTWFERGVEEGAEPYSQEPYFLFDRAAGLLGAEHLAPQAFQAEEVRVIGEDRVDGRPAWVVWYHHTIVGFEGPITDFVTEWIDQESLLLLRQQTNRYAPYDPPEGLLRIIYDIDDPQASLTVPVELPEARLRTLTTSAVVTAAGDAHISRGSPDQNLGDSESLIARASQSTRSLLRFEVDQIPRDAHVLGAWLSLDGGAPAAELSD
jgi:hypothetical protein